MGSNCPFWLEMSSARVIHIINWLDLAPARVDQPARNDLGSSCPGTIAAYCIAHVYCWLARNIRSAA